MVLEFGVVIRTCLSAMVKGDLDRFKDIREMSAL